MSDTNPLTVTDIDRTIAACNLGPIPMFDFLLPKGGGMVILRGASGVGKSQILEAAGCRLAGERSDRLTPSDGEEIGSLTIGTAGLAVNAKTSALTGRLEFSGLNDTDWIGALIDPHMKNPASADAARLRALLAMEGGDVDVDAFLAVDPLVGECITDKTASLTCPVAMAKALKGDIEGHARTAEKAADVAAGRAERATEDADGVDTDVETDPAALADDHQEAVLHHADVTATLKAHAVAAERSQNAKQQLAEAEAEYTGVSLVDATMAADVAGELVNRQQELLRAAQEAFDAAGSAYQAAQDAQDVAKAQQAILGKCKEIIECVAANGYEGDSVAQAEHKMEVARFAVDAGAKATMAITARHMAEVATREAYGHTLKALDLRVVAASIAEVLPGMIKSPEFGWSDGRLTAPQNHRGPDTLFDSLSGGERAKAVVPVAIRAVGSPGMVVIPQDTWQELQPRAQEEVIQLIHDADGTIWGLSAVVDDGELRAEVV